MRLKINCSRTKAEEEETEYNIYDKAERESISLKEIEELLRKNGLK